MNLSNVVNPTRVVYTLFGIVFLTSGLVINVVQITLYILLRPFSKPLFRKINYYISYSLYSQLVFLQQYWANVKLTLHIDRNDYNRYFGKEAAYLIMNHSYEIDWIIGWILCDNCHVLGNVKTFAKKSLQYIPTIGYSWKLGGSIFVERNWQKDQKTFESLLQEFVDYEDPIWLLLAAEGTRFTEEKHEASRIFAKEHGLPELRHHLTPRTKGFAASVPILKKNIAAIYNINVGIKPEGVRPTLTNILLGKSLNADFYVERIHIKDLPEGEADLATWLHSLYKKKDDLIHNYLTTGKWNGNSISNEYDSFLLERRLLPAINFGCWFVCTILPFTYLIIKLLVSGSFFSLGAAMAVIGSFIYFLERLVGETKISKASSYGKSKDFNSSHSLKEKN